MAQQDKKKLAIDYFEANRGLVINRIKKYMSYTVYSFEDFIQTAYCTALEAEEECKEQCNTCDPRKCEKFIKKFWGLLSNNFWLLCDNCHVNGIILPEDKDKRISFLPYDSVKEYVNETELIPADTSVLCSNINPLTSLIEKESTAQLEKLLKAEGQVNTTSETINEEQLLKIGISVMTKKQQQVWIHAVGKTLLTRNNIAGKVGCSRRQVGNLFDNGLKKVRKEVELIKKKKPRKRSIKQTNYLLDSIQTHKNLWLEYSLE